MRETQDKGHGGALRLLGRGRRFDAGFPLVVDLAQQGIDLKQRDVERKQSLVKNNVGSQLDFRLGVLSRLEMTLSAGYAVAFESGRLPRGEAMASLKLLR